MEPVNYSAHAVEGLKEFAETLLVSSPASFRALHNIINMLRGSVKFLLPNCCELLDVNEMRQAHMDLVRLPYPCTAFEAPWQIEGELVNVGDIKQYRATKRIALCWDSFSGHEPLPGLLQVHRRFETGGVFVLSIYWLAEFKRWVPAVGGCFVPYDNELVQLDMENSLPASRIANEAVIKSGLATENARQFRAEPFFILPELFERATQQYGSRDRAYADILTETRDEIMMMIQACSVLNCANVETAEIKPSAALNKKREAKGLQPFFSYKVLQVSEQTTSRVGSTQTGHHASPRMHLRRGHLRRLDEKRAVWVRPTLVKADSSVGLVDKDYRINKAAR